MASELIKSERVIHGLKLGAKRLNDGGGLYLLPFSRGGAHYWRLDYTHDGRRKTISLGVYPQVNLAQARTSAAMVRIRLAEGADPSNDRRVKRDETMKSHEGQQRAVLGLPPLGSFQDVAQRWFSVKKDSWMETYSSKVIRRLELHAFPNFGQMNMRNITPLTVLTACRLVESNNTLETAHRLREHCSAVFRFAIAEGEDLRDPCNDIRDALKRPAVRHFGAITKPDVLQGFLRAAESYLGTAVVRSALQILPMTLVRPGELRLAHWKEFDLDNGLWYVPSSRMKRTKQEKLNGEPHLVPLSRQLIALLEALFKLTGATGHVFPAEGRVGRFMSENTLNAAIRAMGYSTEQATSHGFRATARTLLVEILEYPESVIEMQLAHAVKDANGTAYNRTQMIQKRFEMMQAWSDYLENLRLGRTTLEHPVLPKFHPVTLRVNIADKATTP